MRIARVFDKLYEVLAREHPEFRPHIHFLKKYRLVAHGDTAAWITGKDIFKAQSTWDIAYNHTWVVYHIGEWAQGRRTSYIALRDAMLEALKVLDTKYVHRIPCIGGATHRIALLRVHEQANPSGAFPLDHLDFENTSDEELLTVLGGHESCFSYLRKSHPDWRERWRDIIYRVKP